MSLIRIALVGDRDGRVTSHRAIPRALGLAGAALGIELAGEWVGTDALAGGADKVLESAHGVWCVPASPYRSESGALAAIRFARERGRPFLGTCGGFQHAILEYARHVCGLETAGHAESDPGTEDPVIALLACELVEAAGEIFATPGSRLADAFGNRPAIETYHCRYGLNPRYEERLASGPLRVTGRDASGEVRAIELDGHPFFVATLFQPERAALEGRAHPLIIAFVASAAA